MSEQILKDTSGTIIGRIKTQPDGKQYLHDRTGTKIGMYDPDRNITRDITGTIIAHSNMLTTLLR